VDRFKPESKDKYRFDRESSRERDRYRYRDDKYDDDRDDRRRRSLSRESRSSRTPRDDQYIGKSKALSGLWVCEQILALIFFIIHR